ncbi:MAG: GTP 3',8-cyclase MoaA [Candidatus Anammoxibacter sp.]
MIDKNARHINYLRISVTDMCNLRCIYCRPEEGLHLLDRNDILTFEEICILAKHAVKLGIRKFRFTGGEPLVRKGIEKLISSVSKIRGVEDIAMTTNGILLEKFARNLKRAGLSRINISLDTLKEDKYAEITRGGSLADVFKGIEEARNVGFTNLKINVVVMAGVNDDEIEDFAGLTFDRDIEVRFIELMATRNKKKLKGASFLSADKVIKKIKQLGNLIPLLVNSGNGPAKRFRIEGAKGSLGFINAISNPFCGSCNRLRLTSDGKLRSCLLKGGEVDVKSLIRSENHRLHIVHDEDENLSKQVGLSSDQELVLTEAFHKVINMKPKSHEGASNVLMSQVGG